MLNRLRFFPLLFFSDHILFWTVLYYPVIFYPEQLLVFVFHKCEVFRFGSEFWLSAVFLVLDPWTNGFVFVDCGMFEESSVSAV